MPRVCTDEMLVLPTQQTQPTRNLQRPRFKGGIRQRLNSNWRCRVTEARCRGKARASAATVEFVSTMGGLICWWRNGRSTRCRRLTWLFRCQVDVEMWLWMGAQGAGVWRFMVRLGPGQGAEMQGARFLGSRPATGSKPRKNSRYSASCSLDDPARQNVRRKANRGRARFPSRSLPARSLPANTISAIM